MAAGGTCRASASGTAVRLSTLLDLEQIEQNLFRSRVAHEGSPDVLYGGAVAAQALRAAGHTVSPDAVAHSLHAYFIRPGDVALPVVYRVDIDRDGKSFLSRRVVAIQHGEVILNMVCSFHRAGGGRDFQAHDLPDVDAPESLPDGSLEKVPARGMTVRVPRQIRPDAIYPTRIWARNDERLGDDPIDHACGLLYLSDVGTGLALVPDVPPGTHMPTLDHSMWFYRPARIDEWVLMDLQAESTSAGRGTYTGRIFARDGRLIAGLVQESLFRVAH